MKNKNKNQKQGKMKTRILTVALAMTTVFAFAQKKEIRNAEDAVEEGNYAKAKTLLQQVESQIAEESENTQTDYYLVKAQAFLGAQNGKNTSSEDLMMAAKAFKKVKELGEVEAGTNGITAVTNALVNAAIADQKKQDYKAAAEKLYNSYQLRKKDTIYLYYAASNSVQAHDYDAALDYYKKLMELNYDGSETQYMATEKETGEVKYFSSAEQRDLFIKTGSYENPETKVTPSKTGEIAKNIALIYIDQNKPTLAKEAMKKAKVENPNDLALLQAEANMYYKMGEVDTYNKLMKEIVKNNPGNAELYFNLAVSSAELGDTEGAIEYYKKAIKYDPEMVNAYINLAVSILKDEKDLLEKMNKALADGNNTKYDELAKKRKVIYNEALPYLQKANKIKPEDVEIIRTMMNIYYVLGNTEKAKEMQTKMDSLTK